MNTPRWELWFYAFVRGILVAFCRVFWRQSFEGLENVPREGPFVLAPVHRSNADTPLVAGVTRRRLRYMGKEEVWKYALVGRVLTALGGFPVRRGTVDRDAFRRCVAVIESGEPLVIFPEGTRREGPRVEDLSDGAAYISLRTGAPIVPVGIGGSSRAMPRGSKFLRPAKVHVVVGPSLDPRPGEAGGRISRRAVRELTDRLRNELQRLFEEAEAKADPGARQGAGVNRRAKRARRSQPTGGPRPGH